MKPALFAIIYTSFFVASCNLTTAETNKGMVDSLSAKDTILVESSLTTDSILDSKDSVSSAIAVDTIKADAVKTNEAIDVKNVSPDEVIKFAETLIGTPYVYGSTDPKVGFDCSGFITYVFNHFKIKVPRSSVQFTNVGKTVPIEEAKRGDIILFTDPDFDNTNSTQVGHMGLITTNEKGAISFIHSTSGKAMSVAITPFSDHYKKRFVRVGRIFSQNN